MNPRAMLVTRNLPPLRGGMERLNLHLALGLARDAEVAVCGPLGCGAYLDAHAEEVREVPHRPLPWFLARASLAAAALARRHKPALVVAGSGLAAPIAWFAARACGARLAVYAHGLDLVAPSRLYQAAWLPAIRRADLVICNSANTQRLAIERGVAADRLAILHPGTALPPADHAARARFRQRHGLGDGPLLLSVGRLTPRKGLAEFVRHALPAILAQHPDAALVVIGEDARDAVRVAHASERARIVQAADDVGATAALRVLPPCDDAELADAYESADVHVFPVRDVPGDVEGFGMVAIEAAAHGLPTVAFDVGGVADAVLVGRTGELAPAADYQTFASAVSRALVATVDASVREACRDASRGYGWEAFDRSLNALLEPLLTLEHET